MSRGGKEQDAEMLCAFHPPWTRVGCIDTEIVEKACMHAHGLVVVGSWNAVPASGTVPSHSFQNHIGKESPTALHELLSLSKSVVSEVP